MLHPKDTQSLKVSHDTSPTNSIREHRVSFLLMLDDFLSLLFLFSPLPANHARSIIVHFRFASFSIRAPVSATWPNNASQRKIERARGTKISVHRGSRARDALRASNTRGKGGGRGRERSRYHWNTLERKKRGGSSRQVNLPRASFNPLPPRQAEEKKINTVAPRGANCHKLSSRPVFETIFSSPLLSQVSRRKNFNTVNTCHVL